MAVAASWGLILQRMRGSKNHAAIALTIKAIRAMRQGNIKSGQCPHPVIHKRLFGIIFNTPLARRLLAFWLASLVQLGGPGNPMRAQGEGEASMKIYLIRILTGQSDPECN